MPELMFAATAVMSPDPTHGFVLDLFDPLHPSCNTHAEMAYDVSAPFALRLENSPELRSDWLSFFGVDAPTREGLFFLEPYQRGKIPVVLVHGVLSNPVAWVDLANDLRAMPGFSSRYQIWAFRYATGTPFLASASRLRQDLYRAVATIDPAGQDPALRQITLVGHSMGGLVSELQVVGSEDRLWNAVASRPFESIVGDGEDLRSLHEMFFFDPHPHVQCVISIAAPHQGSEWAVRPAGRFGSLLARPDRRRAARHDALVIANPGAFSAEVADRVPTSIDMLDPESNVLKTIATLPKSPRAEIHTIFGYGRERIASDPGDGVVAVESALSLRAASQTGVEASHTEIHRTLECVQEIVRILNERSSRLATRNAFEHGPMLPENPQPRISGQEGSIR